MGSNNFIEKYELVDGWAIVNNNFKVISANENYYRFVGIARYYLLTDVIHQVDLDDFIEVANSLKANTSKVIVIRMRRVDNSYRWMLVEVKRGELYNNADGSGEDNIYEYLELNISDVQVLQSQNHKLRQRLNEYNHLLALEGELVFSIDLREKYITVNRFVDDAMTVVSSRPVIEVEEEYRKNNIIQDTDSEEFEALCRDISEGTPRFVHQFSINDSDDVNSILQKGRYEIKASTYFENGKKSRIVGTIARLDNHEGFSKTLVSHEQEILQYTSEDVIEYVKNNMKFNPSGEIMLLLLQVDTLDDIEKVYGKKTAQDTFAQVLDMCYEKIKDRGIVGVNDNNIIYMAIKDINIEINARAFIESLRTMIVWKYKMMSSEINLTFSIGVSRYPFNGKDYDKMILKAHKALEIANFKGRNRFIIYKEQLHGEL